MKIAIIGAGWAGLACAVRATQLGHHVTLFEASRTLGGRARAVARTSAAPCDHPNTQVTQPPLDNGQHILIGAYTDTLALLRTVGVKPEHAFLRLPLSLRTPDGHGLHLPYCFDRPNAPSWLRWASPLDGFIGIARAKGWSARDKLSLLRSALGWQLSGFRCAPELSVAALCHTLPPSIVSGFIDPLCVSALNTPADRASAQVFLRVLKDALFGPPGGSNLLLPRVDLGQLLPAPAARWLAAHGCTLHTGQRLTDLDTLSQADGTSFDHIVLATPPGESARLVGQFSSKVHSKLSNKKLPKTQENLLHWARTAQAIPFEAIATVYVHGEAPSTMPPMTALRSTAAHPAQFVFDRSQLGHAPGQLAFVISAAQGDAATLTQQVVAQAQAQLGLHVRPIQTIVEKRATFACLPGLNRPCAAIAPGLWACGDYIEGPYPATLEGAVRSGTTAADALGGAGITGSSEQGSNMPIPKSSKAKMPKSPEIVSRVNIPNAQTAQVLRDSDAGVGLNRANDMDDLFEQLGM